MAGGQMAGDCSARAILGTSQSPNGSGAPDTQPQNSHSLQPHTHSQMQPSSKRRASPCGGRPPPPPPRITRARSLSMSLNMNTNNGPAPLPGLQLVAALDEPAPRGATLASSGLLLSARRPRSDSTMSSDTFDGIYSLGDVVDVDDVDMMSDELCEIDDHVGDVFRPSALLDHKLEDVYNSSSSSRSCSTTSSSSLDESCGRPSDLERMLLISEEEEDDTAAVMAHLARLDSMQSQSRTEEPPTTTTAIQTSVQPRVSGFCPLLPGDHKAMLVVAAATLVNSNTANGATCERHSQHMEIVASLPPKDASTHRRRAHKRTFGEHMASFNFRFATVPSSQLPSPSPSPSPPSSSAQCQASASKTAAAKRGRSLFQEAAEDIARRDLDRDEKENHPPPATPDVAMEKAPTQKSAEAETKREMKIEDEELAKPEQLPPQTPVRAAPSSSALPVTDASFQTPLRRSVTLPAATTSSHGQAAALSTFLTPSFTATATTVMSPAPSFDKIAVVHAKDTPGRVDKFEWTIRPREAIRAKTALFTTTTPSQLQQQKPVEPLPPRYLFSDTSASSTGGSSSPPKRRIHTTTFGSFARSFSFTASNH